MAHVGVSKHEGPFLGVPVIRIIVCWEVCNWALEFWKLRHEKQPVDTIIWMDVR